MGNNCWPCLDARKGFGYAPICEQTYKHFSSGQTYTLVAYNALFGCGGLCLSG